MSGSTADAPEGLPAPLAHAALAVLALAPLLVHVPTNLNIVLTAAVTVFAGSWRSVKPEPPAEAMTRKDAMKFPLIGSAVLFSLFLAFKLLPKALVNAVLSLYFGALGALAITATLDPLVAPLLPATLGTRHIELRLPRVPLLLKEGVEFSFTLLELLLGALSGAFCAWYYARKHWFANNVLGLAFSLQGIEHLSLGAVQNGVILLCGLFVYDVFWVFATPVMVSVAKNFDAPIKLLFPRLADAATVAAGGKAPFSMLGLGDIVIPGIFVALMLRYDAEHHAGRPRYFYSAFGGYCAGLGTTILVMNLFQAAQPALLYIVPGVLGAVGVHAALRGEALKVLHWHEKEEGEEAEGQAAEGKAAEGKSEATRVSQPAAAITAAAAAEAKKES